MTLKRCETEFFSPNIVLQPSLAKPVTFCLGMQASSTVLTSSSYRRFAVAPSQAASTSLELNTLTSRQNVVTIWPSSANLTQTLKFLIEPMSGRFVYNYTKPFWFVVSWSMWHVRTFQWHTLQYQLLWYGYIWQPEQFLSLHNIFLSLSMIAFSE